MLQRKDQYGDEYPAAVMRDGTRIPLCRERRFSRSYQSDKVCLEVSRFMDGSASITALELQQEWPNWAEDIGTDFCESSCWLREQVDYPQMLRSIMQHGSQEHWSGIALSVASQLPRDEAFETLVQALRSTELEASSNICQAISRTKHPDAEATLRSHFAALWSHSSLWEDADFINWFGFTATMCISHLIELGASPSDFTEQVRRLSEHVCSRNRESCRNFLSKHYFWFRNERR